MHTHIFKWKNEKGVKSQTWWVNRNFKRKKRRGALWCPSNQTAHCVLLRRHYIQWSLTLRS